MYACVVWIMYLLFPVFCEYVRMYLCVNVCNFICMCVCMHMCVCHSLLQSLLRYSHLLGLTSIFSTEIGAGHQNQWGVYHCWHRGRRVLLLPVDEDSRDI